MSQVREIHCIYNLLASETLEMSRQNLIYMERFPVPTSTRTLAGIFGLTNSCSLSTAVQNTAGMQESSGVQNARRNTTKFIREKI